MKKRIFRKPGTRNIIVGANILEGFTADRQSAKVPPNAAKY